MSTDNYTFLTSAPIPKVIGKMAVPTIISMLITNLYNLADSFFVGQIDTPSTAAVGIAFSVMFFIQAYGFFFGHGSGNYIARELGAKRKDNASRMAATGFIYTLLFSILFLVLGEIYLPELCVFLGSTPSILPYTQEYLGIVLLGAPFIACSLVLNNQMRFQGNAAFAMYGIITGAVLNVVLDPIFIFLCHMGVAGAAVATVIGQLVGLVVLLWMSHKNGNIVIRFRNFTPSTAFLKEIFYGGSPSLTRQGLASIATMMLNIAAATYGAAAIAAMTIVNRICMFIMAVIIGLGQGFQPFCGFSYGAKLYKRLIKGYWFSVIVGTIILSVFTIVGFLYTQEIVTLFRNDDAVIEIGTVALRWQLATLPLNSMFVISSMFLQTCRKPWRANLLAAARQGLYFIPLILILPPWLGLFGVEICQSCSDALSFITTIPVVMSFMKELKQNQI